ncbi:hypothetical protein BT96DRAFT_1018723 [Gymnopus androsaceus JB14]|uniref:DNA replication regulator SLD2 n=1 Tax=Gymnopus androsaceus JB14 TaxID=1447944 RepID=A0A6A4HRD7_9AGAR|nr:hypothetical protein BT96DRAFT_1018723 [Gymnopus androsaceus JB14]
MAAQDESLSALKAEIKAWERNFQGKHQRAPTVEDIRKNSNIESKYRLYKKLSKAAARTSSSTPPPPKASSSILSKSRVLETAAPLSSFNPFSPQKNKGPQKPANNAPPIPANNPFATPTKTKPKPRIREPSPSPVHEPASNLPAEPPSAITRARKRLRGEPVSPSPNKEKRRRVMSRPESDDSDSEDDEDTAGNSSFIADSPAKGSSFKTLFEDASGSTKVKTALTRAKSVSVPAGLFGPIRGQSVPFEDDLDSVLGPVAGKPKQRPKATVNGLSLPSKLVPKKDDLHSTREQPEAIPQSSLTSGKRLLPDSDSESEQVRGNPSTSATVLIPPSPPPKDASSQRPLDAYNKGKGKATSRKKTKLDSDEDMDSLSDDDVKIVPSESRRARAAADDGQSDFGPEFDPLFQYHHRAGDIHGEQRASSTFEVDLPDKLKHVLALSSSEIKLRDRQEEHVVESLIYGRRATHYEPSKGGEIWDVGDVEDADTQAQSGIRGDAIEDDDWEGEPVPWEVGEL